MCLISISPSGTNKKSEFFLEAVKTGAKKNDDGHGFAYRIHKTGVVYYEKGFENIDYLLKEVDKANLKDEDILIIHSRIRSAGSNVPELTHPFEIMLDSENNSPLNCHGRTTNNPVLFHNGTIPKLSITGSSESDTYKFSNFMANKGIWDMFVTDTALFKKTFETVLGTSRFVFLSKEAGLNTIGVFEKDNDYLFSNIGYKSYTSSYYGQHNNYGRSSVVKDKVDNFISSKIISINGNTGDIAINDENKDHFTIKAIKDGITESTNIDYKSGEVYTIYRSPTETYNKYILQSKHRWSNYLCLTQEEFDKNFIRLPLPEYSAYYTNLIKMKSIYNKASKSAVKRMIASINKVINSKKTILKTTLIPIKKDNKLNEFRIDVILKFLEDYSLWTSCLQKDKLVDLEQKKQEQYCDC